MSDDPPSPLARSVRLQERLMLLAAVVVLPLLLLSAISISLSRGIGRPDAAGPLGLALVWMLAIGTAIAGTAIAAAVVLSRRLSQALRGQILVQRRQAAETAPRIAREVERRVDERTRNLVDQARLRQATEAAARDVERDTQLSRAQRMEAIALLTGGIAQDFNNLLTVIVGSLDQLAATAGSGAGSGAGPGDERAALAQAALKAALRGSELTSGLLAFARQQPLSPRPIDLNGRLPAILPVLQRTVGDAVRIEAELAPNLWIADADPAQVEAALVNLVHNACDAMPKGGTLGIVTANAHLDAEYAARNREVEPGDYVMLAVTDTGIGMPPAVVDAAFDPLFTTKSGGRSTGLGLSMVYGFAKQSRGHAKIYSEVGHGTTVRLYLPRSATDAAAQDRGEVLAPPRLPTGTEAILLVEDDPDVRALSLHHLTELGYRVREVANGAEAAAVLEGPVPFDLVFTDIVMPGGMTGYGVADVAVAQRPGIKLLFATGYAGPGTAHGQMRHPRAQMLRKPFRKQELAEAIRAALDGR